MGRVLGSVVVLSFGQFDSDECRIRCKADMHSQRKNDKKMPTVYSDDHVLFPCGLSHVSVESLYNSKIC